MSIDPSLKVTGGALSRHRNVLTRAERIERLKDTKDFKPSEKPVLGLPKTRNIKPGR